MISEGGAFNDKIRDKCELERREKRFNLWHHVDVLLKETRINVMCLIRNILFICRNANYRSSDCEVYVLTSRLSHLLS